MALADEVMIAREDAPDGELAAAVAEGPGGLLVESTADGTSGDWMRSALCARTPAPVAPSPKPDPEEIGARGAVA